MEREGLVFDGDQFIDFGDGTYIDLCPTLDKPAFKLKDGDRVKVTIEKLN